MPMYRNGDMTRNIFVAIFERPLNPDSGVFIDVLNNFLENVKLGDKLCYIMEITKSVF